MKGWSLIETLMYNSTNFFRLTFSQYGKAFSFPHFVVMQFEIEKPSLYISKIGLSPILYRLLIYSSGLLVQLHRLVLI